MAASGSMCRSSPVRARCFRSTGRGSGLVCGSGRSKKGAFMSHTGSTKSSTFADALWRIAYRMGFPLARVWRRLWGRGHEGALVAVQIDRSLLLVRSSYRSAWNFPGGSVRRGETPELAARRELLEEIGLVTHEPLKPAGGACGLWDGRRDRVHFFGLWLEALPQLQFDNREIVGARWVSYWEALGLPLTEPVRAYIEGLADPVEQKQPARRDRT